MTQTAHPRPYLPAVPTPDTFDLMMDDLIAEAVKAKSEYRWLYPSAYSKGRKGNNEKTRRDVSGVGGGIDEMVAGGDPDKDKSETLTNRVKRHLEQAGDHGRKALAHVKGAGTANTRAQEDIDRAAKPTLVALDPLEPALADKPFTPDHLRGMTPTEAKARQQLRNGRLRHDSRARALREAELALAVVRAARKVVEQGDGDPALAPLAGAIKQLDKEAASSVSVPWNSEERVG